MLKTISLIRSFKTNLTVMKKIAEGGVTNFLVKASKLINMQ